MTPENLMLLGLFFFAAGLIALAGFIVEELGFSERLAEWFERRLK